MIKNAIAAMFRAFITFCLLGSLELEWRIGLSTASL
jgi:hypothetical protein